MTDQTNSLEITAPVNPLAASFNPEAPEDIGNEAPQAEEAKPMSAREALEAAADQIEKQGGKIGADDDEAKPEPEKEEEKKPEPVKKEAVPRDPTGKFAKSEPVESSADEAEEEGEEAKPEDTKQRPSEGRSLNDPPPSFLPRARVDWGNTPESVRAEMHRVTAEFEKGKAEYQEDRQFRKELRQFEDLARQHGTTISQALQQYTAIDALLKSNPVEGIKRVLASINIQPEQYAKHVLGQAQYNQQNPHAAETQQLRAHIANLEQSIAQLQQNTQQAAEVQRLSQVENDVIAPFRAGLENDRFDELQEDIVFLLNSGRIPSTLSVQDRLATAYDMAERLNPLPAYATNERLKPATDKPLKPAGKSIRGAPGGNPSPKSASLSPREAVDAAMKAMGL